MTDALTIITDAYREGNLIGIGVEPTELEQAQGLRLLQNVVSSVFGYEVGEKLHDWPVGSTGVVDGLGSWNENIWTRPVSSVRIVANNATPQTLFLPAHPDDGARIGFVDVGEQVSTYPITLNANGRRIEGLDLLVIDTDNYSAEWFYRADLGEWVRREILAIDSEIPFPSEFDDAFTTMLAMRLNPRYGRAMQGESGAWMERSISRLRSRYRQTVVTAADLPVLVMSTQAYNPYLNAPNGGRFGWMN